jgi:hypothetical protein
MTQVSKCFCPISHRFIDFLSSNQCFHFILDGFWYHCAWGVKTGQSITASRRNGRSTYP